jgi:exo-beta-1,3-glucanase (GH17 family)
LISIKNGTSITFVVTEAGYPEANREAKKQNLTLREEV